MALVTIRSRDPPRLNEAERNNAISRLRAGELCLTVPTVFHLSSSTITRLKRRQQRKEKKRGFSRSDKTARDNQGLGSLQPVTSSTGKGIPSLRRMSAQTAQNCSREAGRRRDGQFVTQI